MSIQKNSLRLYRKKSPLNQADVAYILQLPDYSNISRWEQGLRTPNHEVLLAYHVLFEMPVEKFLILQKDYMARLVLEHSKSLLLELQKLKQSQKVDSRIAFLESIVSRLSA
jgi:transcriptional regulator with XRE-family HTH domain